MVKFLTTAGVNYHLEELIKQSNERLVLISPLPTPQHPDTGPSRRQEQDEDRYPGGIWQKRIEAR